MRALIAHRMPDLTQIVMQAGVSLPGFTKRGPTRPTVNQHLRGARKMHEIPNLPFPSLQQPEQAQPTQSASQKPEAHGQADKKPSTEGER
jgi:hypothetical protein